MNPARMPVLWLLLGWLACPALAVENDAVARGREAFQRAQSAYLRKDYKVYLEAMGAAVALRPAQPTYLYNLAGAEALNGHPSQALSRLNQVAAMGMVYPAGADADFTSLKGVPQFEAVLQRFKKNGLPVGTGHQIFRLPQKGLIAEGLARDPASGDYFLGSVRKRLILRIEAKSFQAREFSRPVDQLTGIFGLKVDAERDTLWVCASVVPEMEGYRKEEDGKAELLQYALSTGKLRDRFAAPAGAARHVFGDLAVDRRGNVYVSDSTAPGLWVLRAGAKALEPFLVPGPFTSPQGLDFSPDGRFLFLADYSSGIFRIDLSGKTATLMTSPPTVTLLGIDGLYRHGAGLVAVQNGTAPSRVVGLRVGGNGDRVERVMTLEQGVEKLSAPTLGVVAGRSFWVIANSEWEAFDPSRLVLEPSKTRFPSILQIDLPEEF